MHVADRAGVLPLKALRRRSSLPWGQIFLLIYTAVAVGRIQELIPALAPLRPGLIAGGIALLAWIKAPGTLPEKVPIHIPAVRDVMILVGLAVVLVPISIWPRGSLGFLVGAYFKTVLLFLFVVYWCRTVQDVRRLMWVCCLATAALAVPGWFEDPGANRYYKEGWTYDSNDLALLFVVVLPLILYLFSTSRRAAQVFLLAVALVCVYGVVLTQSRGGLLALIVVGSLALWRSRMTRTTKYAIVLVALLVFGVLAGTAWRDRIRTMWDPQTEYDRTAGGRTDIWKTALVLFVTRPWGVGIDGFVTAEGLYHQGAGKWNAAHNSFIQVCVELGVVGFVVFIRLLTGTLRSLRQVETVAAAAPRRPLTRVHGPPRPARQPAPSQSGFDNLFLLAEALEISLWGFIVGGFFLSQAYSGLLYVLLAMSLVCVRLLNEQKDPARQSEARRLPSGGPTLVVPAPYRTG